MKVSVNSGGLDLVFNSYDRDNNLRKLKAMADNEIVWRLNSNLLWLHRAVKLGLTESEYSTVIILDSRASTAACFAATYAMELQRRYETLELINEVITMETLRGLQ